MGLKEESTVLEIRVLDSLSEGELFYINISLNPRSVTHMLGANRPIDRQHLSLPVKHTKECKVLSVHVQRSSELGMEVI
jgi:hypothetical protein